MLGGLFLALNVSAISKNRGFSGLSKIWVYDFWFLITIRKLRSIEPIIVIWSVLLMGVVYNIHYYTHQELRQSSFRLIRY